MALAAQSQFQGAVLGSVPQHRERRIFIRGFATDIGALEQHTRLARVNIEVQYQEFRSQGAKIDLSIDNRIGGIRAAKKRGRRAAAYANFRASKLAQMCKIYVEISPDKGLERLKTDDADLRYAGA